MGHIVLCNLTWDDERANPVGIVTAKNVFKFYCNNMAKPVFELSSTDQAFL